MKRFQLGEFRSAHLVQLISTLQQIIFTHNHNQNRRNVTYRGEEKAATVKEIIKSQVFVEIELNGIW